ncbi:MAG: hypothetical protein H3C43_07055 [Leptonema sp. (in: Bacteria)]|nr:hypothetical protein [Leptonema sp. (in: bacteria)]
MIKFSYVLLFLSLSSIQAQPFFWSDGVRQGHTFADKRIPYKFMAPDDIVYRIFKEGSFFRFEARSYRSNQVQITITTLRNLRQIELPELRSEIEDGCQTDSIHFTETGKSIRIECTENQNRPANDDEPITTYYLIRQLEISPTIDEFGLNLIDFFELRSQLKIEAFTLQR